jgi:hypothetical protein
MKLTIAIALFAVAGFLVPGNAEARTPQQGHYQTIQFGAGYPQIGVCNVNGVAYPVGQDYRVWGYDANNNPWVIGWVDLPRPNNVWRFHAANGMVFDVQCQ